jgi:hypothetical protein
MQNSKDRWQDLNFNNIKFSYGAGLQLRGTNLQFYLLIMESEDSLFYWDRTSILKLNYGQIV